MVLKLEMNINIPQQKFKCFICNNEFKTTFDLNQHLKMHYIKAVEVSESGSMMKKPVAKLKANSDHSINDPLDIESASHLLLAGSQLSRSTDTNSEMEIKSEVKNMPTLMFENTDADDDKFYADTPKEQQMSLNSNQIIYMSDSRAASKQTTHVCELCASVFVNNIDLQKHIHEMHNHQMTPSSMFLSFPTAL